MPQKKKSKHQSKNESVTWEAAAADRIAHYGKAGLALRGARFREGLSQKELAKRSEVSEEIISKIENGKAEIDEKVAKKLSKILHIDNRLLCRLQCK